MTIRTLTDDEMGRIKAECMDNVLGLGAVPYIGIRAVYDVIRDNVQSSATDPTTSNTTVSAAGAATLTLASVSGLSTGTRVVLDVDGQRETVTVRAVVGSTISVVCTRTHDGTYPVEIESPLTIVRGLLADLVALDQQQRDARGSAGLKQVDEVQWFGGSGERSQTDALAAERQRLRHELARACGIDWIVRAGEARGAGGSGEVY